MGENDKGTDIIWEFMGGWKINPFTHEIISCPKSCEGFRLKGYSLQTRYGDRVGNIDHADVVLVDENETEMRTTLMGIPIEGAKRVSPLKGYLKNQKRESMQEKQKTTSGDLWGRMRKNYEL